MLTIHVAEATPETAVLVDGDHVAAVGPYEDLVAVRPEARVRRWSGILTPGLLNPYGPELLEGMYHPDPREAEGFGTEPIPGERAQRIFRADPARRAASARRGCSGSSPTARSPSRVNCAAGPPWTPYAGSVSSSAAARTSSPASRPSLRRRWCSCPG